MKKRNVAGLIVIALFVIGIAAALMQYKREQKALEQPEVGEEPETVVLSADENPFGVEIKKINENYDLTKNYYKNYDNKGLEEFKITGIFTDEREYIVELRKSGYCKYAWLDEEEQVIYIEMTQKQKEEWIDRAIDEIDKELNSLESEELYKFTVEDDYTVIKLDIDQSALIDEMGEALIVLIYDSELYQIFNGNENWSIHIMVNDMETQKEMMNIQFPKEKFRLSPDMWEKVKTNE